MKRDKGDEAIGRMLDRLEARRRARQPKVTFRLGYDLPVFASNAEAEAYARCLEKRHAGTC